MRVATWNLDGYRTSGTRAKNQAATLGGLEADVLVLTEVMDDFIIPGMTPCFTAPGQPPYKPANRAAGIWSQWPSSRLPVTNERLSVCVALDAPALFGRVIVYGTIITYAMDGVRSKEARAWERHREAVRDVTEDCRTLRQNYPEWHLVLAGDFNMNLDGTKWYGDKHATNLLLEGLTKTGMMCHTSEDIRKVHGADRANIDHIWTSEGLGAISPLKIWNARRDESDQLSDHNGVAIDLLPNGH
ncbi:hypothetical protein QTH91_14610 [Variovorax dokdonensis]|uniref:Endonuclease/exonuclease/phosphatase domain-containing protein n=1 Tax=Variovorax dokdonensis TaxID=344883 RepID=A0ABT7NCP8_9BURK|nr:endonuclease/exonuclease/phosphatase family protein [Variovorax dokdonensis]MDM0045719.1 hypothetical protein [Variovorax dokdonensis]